MKFRKMTYDARKLEDGVAMEEKSTGKSTVKQTTKQSAKESTKQSTEQTTKQTTKQSTKQTTKQSTKQAAKPTVKQTTKQAVKSTGKQAVKPTGKQYTLKVYPAGMSREVYRVIQISGKATLDNLCYTILSAFHFTDEHLYEFCMDNRMYSDYSYQSNPELGEQTTRIMLDKLHLVKGQNFSLHYDFGDDWMFTIHVQKVEEEIQKSSTSVIKAKGMIEQYPSWDDEDWEDEDWDEEDWDEEDWDEEDWDDEGQDDEN